MWRGVGVRWKHITETDADCSTVVHWGQYAHWLEELNYSLGHDCYRRRARTGNLISGFRTKFLKTWNSKNFWDPSFASVSLMRPKIGGFLRQARCRRTREPSWGPRSKFWDRGKVEVSKNGPRAMSWLGNIFDWFSSSPLRIVAVKCVRATISPMIRSDLPATLPARQRFVLTSGVDARSFFPQLPI